MDFIMNVMKKDVVATACLKVKWRNIAVSTKLTLEKSGSSEGKGMAVQNHILPRGHGTPMKRLTQPKIGLVKQILKMAKLVARSVFPIFTWLNTFMDFMVWDGIVNVARTLSGHQASTHMKASVQCVRK